MRFTKANPSPAQMALFQGVDRWVHRESVPSTSKDGVSYTIALDLTGQWGCSCPAWIYSSERKPCKHIREFAPTTKGVPS